MQNVWVILPHEYRCLQCGRHKHSSYHKVFVDVLHCIFMRIGPASLTIDHSPDTRMILIPQTTPIHVVSLPINKIWEFTASWDFTLSNRFHEVFLRTLQSPLLRRTKRARHPIWKTCWREALRKLLVVRVVGTLQLVCTDTQGWLFFRCRGCAGRKWIFDENHLSIELWATTVARSTPTVNAMASFST